MPITIYPSSLKIKDTNGTFHGADCIKGDIGPAGPQGPAGADAVVTIDNTLDSISENPLQNKIITKELQNINNSIKQAIADDILEAKYTTLNDQSTAIFNDTPNEGPIKEIIANINLIQTGEGTPSPENIRPIEGYNEISVIHTGKNLLNAVESNKICRTSYESYTIDNGKVVTVGDAFVGFFAPIRPNTQYTASYFKNKAKTINFQIYQHSEYRTVLLNNLGVLEKTIDKQCTEAGLCTGTFTTRSDARYVSVVIFDSNEIAERLEVSNWQLELGDTATEYEPYQGEMYNITFPQEVGTVYGGKLNIMTGLLTVEWGHIVLDGTINKALTLSTGDSHGFWLNIGNIIPFSGSLVYLRCSHFIGESYSKRGDRGVDCAIFPTNSNGGVRIRYEAMEVGESEESVAAFNEWLVAQNENGTPVEIVYYYKIPQTYQLTPIEIDAMFKTNCIYTNCGDVSVTYIANTKAYIDSIKSRIPDISGKVDKVTNAITGNLAALDENGNLTDSGNKVSDFLTQHQDISGKANKTDTILDTTLSRGRTTETTVGEGSFAFGDGVTASGRLSHAEGFHTVASGDYSHTEGGTTIASGMISHAEGGSTTASGTGSHAEGTNTVASGDCSHAEGTNTVASEVGSHAEGANTVASGTYSHAEGTNTIAAGYVQHVSGRYNIQDLNNTYAEIIGIGTYDNARANGYTLDWNGNGQYAGKVTVNNKIPTEDGDLTSKNYVDDSIKQAIVDDTFEAKYITLNDQSTATFNNAPEETFLKEVIANIKPVQSGEGDPSPENIRPINGYTGINIVHSGKNLLNAIQEKSLDYSVYTQYSMADGVITITGIAYVGFIAMVRPNEQYTASIYKNGTDSAIFRIREYSSYPSSFTNSLIRQTVSKSTNSELNTSTFTTHDQTRFVLLAIYCDHTPTESLSISNWQLELGDTATEYEPYQGNTYNITFPSEAGTVYGGTLNITTGELIINQLAVTFDGTQSTDNASYDGTQNIIARYTLNYPAKSGIATDNSGLISKCDTFKPVIRYLAGSFADFKNSENSHNSYSIIGHGGRIAFAIHDLTINSDALVKTWFANHPTTVVYELETPFPTIYLTPQEIQTLLGINHIYTNSGNISVTYALNTKAYIDSIKNHIPDVSGKIDKINNATSGNLAAIDANGNLADSGKKASDFLTEHQSLANYVQKTDYANDTTAGVVKINSNYGIIINPNSGTLTTRIAGNSIIKEGTNIYQPIAPAYQHLSVFYGLAKAAGDATQAASENAIGTYTTEAKTAIQTMLGIESGVSFVETISSTDAIINGTPNTRYICGEVSSISITPPSAGTVIVRFTSGTTAAVLTLPSTVKMPSWWNGVSPNYTYQLCIEDGVYGSVMAWPI